MLSSRSAIGACQVAGGDVRVGRAASLRAAPQRMCGPLRASHTEAVSERTDSADNSLARRPVLFGALALLGLGQPRSAYAAGVADVALAPAPAPLQAPSSSTTRYEDTIDKFGLDIPAGWVQAEGAIPNEGGFAGATGARRTVAFFPADRPPRDVSLSVVITNVSFEFTKLGSFGNVAAFANNLINSLDRSFLLRRPAWQKNPDEPIQVASLVDYDEKNDQYIIEYTVQKLPEPKRHLLSKLALGSNGTYNRLYTLTAQCNEDELPQYRAAFDVAVDSFIANVKPLV